jgi:hypothetical protein
VRVETSQESNKQTRSPEIAGMKSRSISMALLYDKLAKCAHDKPVFFFFVRRARLTTNICHGVGGDIRQLRRAVSRVIAFIGNGKIRKGDATYRTASAQSHAPTTPPRLNCYLNFTTYSNYPSQFGCVGSGVVILPVGKRAYDNMRWLGHVVHQ